MRTHAVLALERTRVASALLLSLLVGGALLGDPVPASAQGRVTFTQMSIERCKGTCELKLSCSVGGKPASELVSDKKGRTKDLFDIGKSLEVPQFPTEVKCTASKDTGWISTTWTTVGSGTATVPSGSAHKVDIHRGEGSVRVLLAVDSLESFLPAGPAPAAAPAKGKKAAAGKAGTPLQVAATFNPSKEGHAVVIGLELPAFKAKVDKMGALGLKLVSIKVFDQGGKKLWAGIFKNVPDRVVLRTNEEWKEFQADWVRLTGGLARLVDVEVYNPKPLYAGLFRDFSDRNRPMMWTDERKNFVGKVKELAAGGQQLIDVEVYVGPGKTSYIGTFRATSGNYDLWTNNDKAGLAAKWKGGATKDLQMVEVVPYKESGKRLYDAIVRTGMGDSGETLLDADMATFVKHWLDDTGKGLRLTSFAPYHD